MEAIQLNKHTMQIIDPHVHLFDLAKGQYLWLKPENEPFWPDKAVINKNFSASDLSLSAPLSLYGFVHIEAGFDNLEPWREIAWLEQNCQDNFRAVAMLDITLSPAMFNEASQLLNIEPKYILHVGDNLIKDVQGAVNSGYQSAWFACNRSMNLANEPVTMLPHLVLNTLDELLAFI